MMFCSSVCHTAASAMKHCKGKPDALGDFEMPRVLRSNVNV